MFNITTGKIMVMEDERVNREMLGAMLKDRGYNVLLLEDGQEGLERVNEYEPDLILTDIMMPRMDGFEFTRRLRAQPHWQHVPIIMVTSLDDRDCRVQGLEEGAADFLTKPVDRQELIARVNNLLRLKKFHDFLRHNNDYLKEYDGLTGLPNWQRFHALVEGCLQRAKQEGYEVGLLLIDVSESLKKVNDSLGSRQGDLVIQALANRLVENCPLCEHVARHGNTEFAVVLRNPAMDAMACRVAEELVKLLTKPVYLNEQSILCTVHMGITLYPLHGQDANSLLRRANLALHNAQSLGGTHYRFFEPDMDVIASERLALESALQQALENEQLEIYYQPQIELRGGQIVGAEALLRWCHPKHGWISPVRFIPLAEEIGLINQLGEWILLTACCEWQRWRDMGFGEVRISINLSLRQFRNPALLEEILRILKETGTDARALGFEITESCTMENVGHTQKVLKKLSDLGAKISIDDFGTGYSSLAYLTQLPVDMLKIDRAFVKNLPHEPSSVSLIAAVVSLAHGLGLQTIAEGVETEEQLEFLRRQGCIQSQGFLHSPPVPAAQFRELLKTWNNK